MTENVMRRYTFKLYPNVAQLAALENQRRLHSALYNALIEERISAYARPALQWSEAPDAKRTLKQMTVAVWEWIEEPPKWWQKDKKFTPGYFQKFHKEWQRVGVTRTAFDQGRAVTELRAAFPEYDALSRGSMEQTVKRVDLAFKAFFSRAKSGGGAASGFPKFKRIEGFGLREVAKGGWRLDTQVHAQAGRVRTEVRRMALQGIPGRIRVRGCFPGIPTSIKTGDLMLRANTWWLSVVVELPARMRADEHNSGEVRFDLVDSFAQVSCADGPCGAVPEETVYAAADGRIILPYSGVKPTSGADTLKMEGEGKRMADFARVACGADTLKMEGEGKALAVQGPHAGGADTLKMEGEGKLSLAIARLRCGADTLKMEGEGNGQRPLENAAYDAYTLKTENESKDIGDHQPTPLRADAVTKITALQQRMSACKRGSARYRKLRLRKARLEARLVRQRSYALHKWTTLVARRFATLRVITALIAKATASGHGESHDPGAQTAMKADFNKRVLSQAPASAVAMLGYKVAERGGTVDVQVAENHPAMIGNDIVTAAKEVRKTRKEARRAKGTARGDQHVSDRAQAGDER